MREGIGKVLNKWTVGMMTVLLLVAIYTIPTQAGSYGTLSYSVENGEVAITSCNPFYEGIIVVPATIDGYPVTSIGKDAFIDCEGLTSVVLPEGIKTIDDSAFEGCLALRNVNIPSTVTSIGTYAFSYTGMSIINIPEGVTTIGDFAFHRCRAIF